MISTKIMFKKCLMLFFVIFLTNLAYSKSYGLKVPDSLSLMGYEDLFNSIAAHHEDSVKQSLYLSTFLYKAKSENNAQEIINGYKNYLDYSEYNLKLLYADSMIFTAKKTKDNVLIGSSYLSKGIIYYDEKKLNHALDNYLIANNYTSKTDDKLLICKVKHNMAVIKYNLGFYDEAIILFNDCIEYFKKKNSKAYLKSLRYLGLCYNKTDNYDKCSQINKKGISDCKQLKNIDMVPYFLHSEGVNQYFLQNYALAISNISNSLIEIRNKKDFGNEAVGYFYLGKSYWDLKNYAMAIPYFNKVDTIFKNKNYIRFDLRENYELLINFYKSKKNQKLHLYYIEQLLKVDKILDSGYKYMSNKIYKEYDTKELLANKKVVEEQLHKKRYHNLVLKGIIGLLLVPLVFVSRKYGRIIKRRRQNSEELRQETEALNKKTSENKKFNLSDINLDTVSSLLTQLEKFEKDKKFLAKNLTVTRLAVMFSSNAKYVSKVIFYYRGKKFVDYINDLKIDYVISLLKVDKKFSNYTNKALAEEAGFSSTQRFTNAFLCKKGISATCFIAKFREENSHIEEQGLHPE